MAKDFRENRRGCFIIAALVAALVAALAYVILDRGRDPRSDGIAPSGSAPAAAPAAPADAARPEV